MIGKKLFIVGGKQGNSSNGLHFLDAIFLDQWYPGGFLAKSMVTWGRGQQARGASGRSTKNGFVSCDFVWAVR